MRLTRRGFMALTGAGLAAGCAPNVHHGQDADVLILGAGDIDAAVGGVVASI